MWEQSYNPYGDKRRFALVFRKLTLYLKIGFNIIRWGKIEKNRKSWQFSRGEYNSEFDYWRSLNSSFC